MALTEKEAAEEKRKTKFDKERAELFAGMVATAAWKMYVELLNAQVGARTKNIFEPTPSGGELASEHNKGTVYGLLWARDLPSTIIESTKDERASQPADED